MVASVIRVSAIFPLWHKSAILPFGAFLIPTRFILDLRLIMPEVFGPINLTPVSWAAFITSASSSFPSLPSSLKPPAIITAPLTFFSPHFLKIAGIVLAGVVIRARSTSP